MIISTGMRTDIPAFYSNWLINRIEAGFVCVRNPYSYHQVTRYSLDPRVVDCITFCTKNPLPILDKLDRLSDYKQFWFVTITPYGRDYEPNVPDVDAVIGGFRRLSERLGPEAVHWRYDPIFYGDGYDFERHKEGFSKIASALKGATEGCVISFLDRYEKVVKNAPGIYPPVFSEQKELGKALAKIAKENGINVRSCCEGTHLSEYGIDASGCQTQAILERAIGEKLERVQKNGPRVQCECLLGNDIGAYDSCMHLCKYCYANTDKDKVKRNIRRHDENSPFLLGGYEEGDVVTEAKQESMVRLQESFF